MQMQMKYANWCCCRVDVLIVKWILRRISGYINLSAIDDEIHWWWNSFPEGLKSFVFHLSKAGNVRMAKRYMKRKIDLLEVESVCFPVVCFTIEYFVYFFECTHQVDGYRIKSDQYRAESVFNRAVYRLTEWRNNGFRSWKIPSANKKLLQTFERDFVQAIGLVRESVING